MTFITSIFKGVASGLKALPKTSKLALGSGVVGAVGGGVATYNILGGLKKGEENANNSKNDAVTDAITKGFQYTYTDSHSEANSYIYANNYGSGIN